MLERALVEALSDALDCYHDLNNNTLVPSSEDRRRKIVNATSTLVRAQQELDIKEARLMKPDWLRIKDSTYVLLSMCKAHRTLSDGTRLRCSLAMRSWRFWSVSQGRAFPRLKEIGAAARAMEHPFGEYMLTEQDLRDEIAAGQRLALTTGESHD